MTRKHATGELTIHPARRQITFVTKYVTGVVRIMSYRIVRKNAVVAGSLRSYWACEKKSRIHVDFWVPVSSAGSYQMAKEWLFNMIEDPEKRP